jgi:hypothetical protein
MGTDGKRVEVKNLSGHDGLIGRSTDENSLNPNPGGLVANMTSKTQNCCDKFIIYFKKTEKAFVIL